MTQAEDVEKRVWIPKVPKRRIQKLAERIKPVVRFAKGEEGLFRSPKGFPYHIKQVDLFDVSYTWNVEPTNRVVDLKPLCEIRTYHGYGHYSLFKPSIAEVLAQIPAEHLDRVVAFEIVVAPETADDLNREGEACDAGYHVATTRLYTRE